MKKQTEILIVDDKLGSIYTLSDILQELGNLTHTASNGREAIEIVKNNNIDIALIDIKMPKINGVETLREIKLVQHSIKAFMMTAYSDKKLLENSLKEGAIGIFLKPLNIKKLLKVINQCEKGKIIIIVDDDSNFSQSLKEILQNGNDKVIVAV
ncbi:MAG: response regulator [Promethearchaeota archaeon]